MSTPGGRLRSVDVVILTAIQLEYDAAREVSAGAVEGSQWEEERRPNGLRVSFRPFHGKKGGRPLRVALAVAGDMGAVATTTALLPLVEEYRPRCVAMCGVCAGRPGKTNLGDVIAPDRLFFHDTGKRRPEGVQQDLTTYNLRYDWKEDLKRFDFIARFKDEAWWKERPVPYEWQENWALLKLHEGVTTPWKHPELDQFCPQWEKVIDGLIESGHVQNHGAKLTDKGRERVESFLFRNRGRLPDLSPTGKLLPFRVHFDPMGSGSQVIEDVTYWNTVTEHMRKTLGLEMEAAAIGALAQAQVHLKLDAIVMKGVMDFANHGRDDHFKEYAARASAECLMAFLREHLDVEVVPGVDDLLTTGSAGEPPANAPPSALLNARHEVAPFHGRKDIIAELDKWCDEGPTVSVQLLHAEGGAGKTRLAIEWVRLRREQGWTAGFLPEEVPENWLESLWSLGKPILVVLDYAESHPGVSKALARLHRYSQQQDTAQLRHVRLLLLARNDGDWWKSLRQRDTALDTWLGTMPSRELPSLADTQDERDQVFQEAAEKFARKLQKPYVRRPMGRVLRNEHFERVLYVHMAALAWVEGLAFEPNTLMDVILDHEERFWEVRAGQTLAGHAVQRSLARQVIAAATLRGGLADREEADLVVGRLLRRPVSENDATLLQLLNWVYQRGPEGPPLFLPALEPDLLGEAMVLRVTSSESGSREYLPSDWIDRVLPVDEREHIVVNGLKVLGRASATQPSAARPWIERLLAGSLIEKRAPLALEAAKAVGQLTVLSVLGDVLADRLEASGDVKQARQLAAAGIPFPTVSLGRVAEWTGRTLLRTQSGLQDEQSLAERAELLHVRGVRLDSLGRHEEALTATKEAVQLRRSLAAHNADTFLPDLAMSLNNLGNTLSELGRQGEALTATEETVRLYRDLGAHSADAFRHDLAMSLNNLGIRLTDLGRREEAMTATEEAVQLYRYLAARNADAFRHDLAMSLNNLGIRLSNLGRHEEALTATEEAVQLYRGLAERNADAFLPDLAMSLNNLGIRLNNLGRHEEALTTAKEAVQLRRGLAERNAGAFLPDLAKCLNNLGNILSELGRHEEALTTAKEAVQIRRDLAERNADAFRPDLATSINNLGNRLSDLGRHEEALSATEEAVQLRRALAEQNADAFLPYLAYSLNNLSNRLSDLDRPEEALQFAREAIDKLWPFFTRSQQSFERHAGIMLSNLEELHERLKRPLSPEIQERIATFKRLTES